MEPTNWVCPHCWNQVPIAHRELHEARCSGNRTWQESTRPDLSDLVHPVVDWEKVWPTTDAKDGGSWREVEIIDSTGESGRREALPSGARDSAIAISSEVQTGQGPEQRARQNPKESGSGRGRTDDVGTSVRRRTRPQRRGGARRHGPEGTRTMESEESRWTCAACTLLNDRNAQRCAACHTRIPPSERPPDARYRDTLIQSNGDAADLVSDELEQWRMAMEEASRCERRERSRNAASPARRGGAEVGASSTMSDAATGSAIGALGAGVLSALAPGNGNRPGRVMASILQGALVGGVAGAAFGPEIRRSESTNGGNRDAGRELDRTGPRRSGRRGTSTIVVRDGDGATVFQDFNPISVDGMQAEERFAEQLFGNFARAQDWTNVPGAVANRPASRRTIAHLPEEVLTANSIERMPEDGRQCCICLENFESAEAVTRLPCLHVYHAPCIASWLRHSGTCPTCKHRVD